MTCQHFYHVPLPRLEISHVKTSWALFSTSAFYRFRCVDERNTPHHNHFNLIFQVAFCTGLWSFRCTPHWQRFSSQLSVVAFKCSFVTVVVVERGVSSSNRPLCSVAFWNHKPPLTCCEPPPLRVSHLLSFHTRFYRDFTRITFVRNRLGWGFCHLKLFGTNTRKVSQCKAPVWKLFSNTLRRVGVISLW